MIIKNYLKGKQSMHSPQFFIQDIVKLRLKTPVLKRITRTGEKGHNEIEGAIT